MSLRFFEKQGKTDVLLFQRGLTLTTGATLLTVISDVTTSQNYAIWCA